MSLFSKWFGSDPALKRSRFTLWAQSNNISVLRKTIYRHNITYKCGGKNVCCFFFVHVSFYSPNTKVFHAGKYRWLFCWILFQLRSSSPELCWLLTDLNKDVLQRGTFRMLQYRLILSASFTENSVSQQPRHKLIQERQQATSHSDSHTENTKQNHV